MWACVRAYVRRCRCVCESRAWCALRERMGIQGLLPVLKTISKRVYVPEEYAGKVRLLSTPCVRACVPARGRACVRARTRVCVLGCVRARACVRGRACEC